MSKKIVPESGPTDPDHVDITHLHGHQVIVEEVDVLEDADGIPTSVRVEREMATVVIVPSLLGPSREASLCMDVSPREIEETEADYLDHRAGRNPATIK